MTDWIAAARGALAAGPAALVTVLATEGSAPRGPGARMVVTAATAAGTIGGGRLEYQAISQARALLGEAAGAWRVQDYPLGPLLGQCCGGRVRLLVERLSPSDWLAAAVDDAVLETRLEAGGVARAVHARALDGMASLGALSARGERPGIGAAYQERLGERRRPLLLFGAGHVGRAIAHAAEGLPLTIGWFDTRAELAGIAGLTIVPADTVAECVAAAEAEAAILILTHDHGLDYALTAAALRSRAGFVGLIGSATKRARFARRLAAEGLAETRLTCPIGLPGIVGKAPAVIAIAALAQILALG